MKTVVERFHSKYEVSQASGCWLWIAASDKNGYGRFGLITRKPKKTVLAHRASWELHFHKIPDGLYVCHKCDTPACVNPKHLFIGTQAANLADCFEKGRTTQGVKHGNSKLTDLDVEKIKNAKGTQKSIAVMFGIDRSAVSLIKSGKRWGHTS